MHLWQYQKKLRATLNVPSLLSTSLGKSLIPILEQLSVEEKSECFSFVNDYM